MEECNWLLVVFTLKLDCQELPKHWPINELAMLYLVRLWVRWVLLWKVWIGDSEVGVIEGSCPEKPGNCP